MDSSIDSNIPRLGETKVKPKIGEIRIGVNGKRRKIFDGKCWQYLCIGDPNCRIQAKLTCRNHRNFLLNESSTNKIQRPKPGDTQILPNGNRRIWRGARWHSLCRVDNCFVQAKDLCKTHQTQRISLPNTNQNISEKSPLTNRARSCTFNDNTEKTEQENPEPSPSIPQLTKRRRHDDNIFDTIAVSPLEKRELHTRNGRRVRCNGLIWKHLCADTKKNTFYKRKYQRQSVPIKKPDQIIETNQVISLPSDTIDSSKQTNPITPIKKNTKRKTTGDISNEEHIVPKRSSRQRRNGSNKSIILHLESNSSNASVSDLIIKDKSIEESVLNDSDISLSLKSNRFNTNSQSIEIPVQSSSFNYDSSPSAILEQFGTIIKKEAIIEDDALICVPSLYTNSNEFPCETLQDFLRAEDIKKKEFKLDCQRISYRLAKIQDCIGNISSITS